MIKTIWFFTMHLARSFRFELRDFVHTCAGKTPARSGNFQINFPAPEQARRLPNLRIVKSFFPLEEKWVRRGIRLGAGRPNWLSWPFSAMKWPNSAKCKSRVSSQRDCATWNRTVRFRSSTLATPNGASRRRSRWLTRRRRQSHHGDSGPFPFAPN